MSIVRIGITSARRAAGTHFRDAVNASYSHAVLAAGGLPLILPQSIGAARASEAVGSIDGLLLSGGDDIDPALYGAEPSPLLGPIDPARDHFELAAFAGARQRGMPTLGICRGLQLINVGLGGTLWQDLPTERPGRVNHDPGDARNARVHPVRVEAQGRMHEAIGATSFSSNSFHHQGVRTLAPGLVARGWTEDDLIEVFEGNDERWLVAVQWHPEEMHADLSSPDQRLIGAFVSAARQWAAGTAGS